MFSKAKLFLLSVGSSLVFTACDPAQIMIIKGGTDRSEIVSIYASKLFLPRPVEPLDEKIMIQFPTQKVALKQDTVIMFGLGGWGNDDMMHQYVKSIDSIVFKSKHGSKVLAEPAEIECYLLKQRSGFAKRKLTIEAP